jgi:hypothetical protein
MDLAEESDPFDEETSAGSQSLFLKKESLKSETEEACAVSTDESLSHLG